LCDDCRRRLDVNPLRVLDCKAEGCQQAAAGAPSILEFLCGDCQAHFDEVKRLLALAGVAHAINPRLVRGLDYYVRTTFEAVAGDLGAQNAVAGGGRYDGLVQRLGGPAQACIGFGAGIERLALLIDDRPEWQAGPDLFIAAMGPAARDWAFACAQVLRARGLRAEMTGEDKSLKAQMRRADKLGAVRVLIVGEAEMAGQVAVLKEMTDRFAEKGGQREIALGDPAALAELLEATGGREA
ncbi:MAG: ATP phosphoribosyltransferase regulatory subunit, partial [Pseudomonadota bacterium]